VRGAHVTVGRRGIRKTVGIPGTGIFYTSSSGYHPGVHSVAPGSGVRAAMAGRAEARRRVSAGRDRPGARSYCAGTGVIRVTTWARVTLLAEARKVLRRRGNNDRTGQ